MSDEREMMPVPKWRLGDRFTIEEKTNWRGDTRHVQWEIIDQPWVNNGEWWYPMTHSNRLNFPEGGLPKRDESVEEVRARLDAAEQDGCGCV